MYRVGLSRTTGFYQSMRPITLLFGFSRFGRTSFRASAVPFQSRVITSSQHMSLVNAGSSPESIKVNHTNPDDWHPVYRLNPMPVVQAISRLKFLLTSVMLIGTPFVVYAAQHDYVSPGFTPFFIGTTVFSLGTLVVFSYFSTKVIGVVSIHKTSGLVRFGHLTFWGSRVNTLISLEHLVPPTDFADNPGESQTVRVGVLSPSQDNQSNSRIQQMFLLTRIRGQTIDEEAFERLFGFNW